MNIFIKKIGCHRTKQIVLEELENIGLKIKSYELGKIDLEKELLPQQMKSLESALNKHGLQLSSGESSIVSLIREAINDLIENKDLLEKNISVSLSKRLGYDFEYLNDYFRRETGYSIEDLFLENSIEYRKRKKFAAQNYLRLLGEASK